MNNSQLAVFDRWGSRVFMASGFSNDWDGVDQNGRPLDEGAYYFVLTGEFEGSDVEVRGSVSLIRD